MPSEAIRPDRDVVAKVIEHERSFHSDGIRIESDESLLGSRERTGSYSTCYGWGACRLVRFCAG